jgi:glycyl-tRNA synthetase (class II)
MLMRHNLQLIPTQTQSRVVLKLKPHLAPVKVAVIPLKKNNEDIVNLANEGKVKIQRLGLGRIIFPILPVFSKIILPSPSL